MNCESNILQRSKKPKPLFGLFRKAPAITTTAITSPTMNLGSGAGFLPLDSSILDDSMAKDPYTPVVIQPKRRQRSKSVGREATYLEERELALNKLCRNEKNATSLADSLPLLLSPTMTTSRPPMPKLKKSSSVHDIKKATKLQQESIKNTYPPLPIKNTATSISRSKSLNRLKSPKSQQQLSSTVTKQEVIPPLPTTKYNKGDDSDDDIPLGYLQSPTKNNRPSSLLSDRDDDDDTDLIPIAIINNNQDNHRIIHSSTQEYQSAADKYKERVKERLNITISDDYDDDDDDDIPISTLLSPKDTRYRFKK